jgi:hypothetical protein
MSEAASIVISSSEERNRLLGILKQVSGSMTRVETEKEYVKETTKKIVEEFQLPPKLVAKLIKTFHKQNFKEVVATEEQFQSLYTQVTGE